MGFSRQEYWSGVPLPSPILNYWELLKLVLTCLRAFFSPSASISSSRVRFLKIQLRLIGNLSWTLKNGLAALGGLPLSILLGYFSSVQFSSVTQSCPTLCDCMNCSTPGLPVHHQLLEFTQTPVHRVSDAIQPSHPLSSPSPAPNLSQHQSLIYRKCLLSCSSLPCSLCFLKSHRLCCKCHCTHNTWKAHINI